MPYTIRRYENTYSSSTKNNILVLDNTTDTAATSISLIGQASEEYLTPIAENGLWMLEKFYSDAPPGNALIGQLWWRDDPDPEVEGLYFWRGPDPDNGGNSGIAGNWTPLINDLSDELETHILTVSPQNPHQLTKDQLVDVDQFGQPSWNEGNYPGALSGLGAIGNYTLFDKRINFQEYIDESDTAGQATARGNLNVYDRGTVYTQAQVDAMFEPIGGTTVNTQRLDGYLADEFVLVSAPVITSGIDANSITEGRLWETDDAKVGFIVSESNTAIGLRSGINDATQIITANDSGVDLLLVGLPTNPYIQLNLYAQGSAGSSNLASQLTIYNDGVYFNSAKVFGEGFKPTPHECNTYEVDEKVSNASLLNGYTDSVDLGDTIARRNGTTISGTWLFIPGTPVGGLTANSALTFRNTGAATLLRNCDVTAFQKNILTGLNVTQGSGSFNGALSSGSHIYQVSSNTTITKLGTGYYQIRCYYFTGLGPSTSDYPIILGADDGGGQQTSYSTGSYRLVALRCWVNSITRNNNVSGNPALQYLQFSINAKRVQNRYNGVNAEESFSNVRIDPGHVSFNVIW